MAQSIFYDPLDGLKKCVELYDALWRKENSTLYHDVQKSQCARNTLLVFFKNACEGFLSKKHVREWKMNYL